MKDRLLLSESLVGARISGRERPVATHSKSWLKVTTGGDVQDGQTSFQFTQSKRCWLSSQWPGVSQLVVGSLFVR